MKLYVLIFLCVFLVACGVEFGDNYRHLQEQDPTGLRSVDYEEGTNVNVKDKEKDDTGVFDSLNENLCELNPLCCGEFTDDQKDARDWQRRAVIENRSEFCYNVPSQELIISCPDREDEILYSRSRCLENFE